MIRMMKIQAAFVLCVVLLQAVANETCKGVYFDGKPYDEQLLKADVYHPQSLAVDDRTKTVYFSYLQLYYLEFRTVALDLATKQFKRIDVHAGSATTVDQKHHLVYIGGAQGLYEYDSSSNETRLVLPEADVWRMHFREALYYIEFISHNVYKYHDGESTLYDELAGVRVYFFAKDDDYMVYSNETGVYGRVVGAGDSVTLKQVKNVDAVKEISLDREGTFFVLFPDGIYKVDRPKQSLDKVADITGYGMAFDADNQLIYSKEASVYRLVPDNNCKI